MVLPAFRAIRSRVGWRDPVDNAAKVVHRFKLIACIVIWFGSSAVSTACAKVALSMLAPKAGSCALTITSVQFTAAALAAVAACVLLRRRPPPAARELVFVSIAYTLGFLFLNQSLNRLAASFTETVRGLEPLTSFALAWLLGARGSQLVPVTATALGIVLSIGGSVAYAMGKEAPARARPERLLSFSESDVEGEPTEQAHLNPDDLHGLPPTVARNVACGDNLSATSGKADNPRCTSRT